MLNNYAESGGGFNSNHGQTSRPVEATPKQHNISSSWGSYNSQLEGMYYGGEQAVYMGPYDGSSKHASYPHYPHQPVPAPVVKCQEACCQHFQDRYPLNPAPLRYQPTQPRYDDSRQYITDRRAMQPTLSRKKAYPTDNAFPGIPDRHYSQFMGRGQFMADSRQQMQMMRSQYPMYSPYWGSARGYGPRMNCPPPPYHQSIGQGAQLQAGLKINDTHYMDPTQKSLGAQRHRTVGSSGSEIIRPVPDQKRSSLDPNIQSYEFGYPGFVPFSDVTKIQGSGQNASSSCKIPSDKQYHPHQMQYSVQASERNMMPCNNPINDLSYSMNFPLPSGDPYIRAGLEDGQSVPDSRKLNLQYDSSLGKKRPDLDLRQFLATWEDDEEEGTRLSEPVAIGNNGAPYIVVDCRPLENESTSKIQERFKSSSQNCGSKSRSSSPNGDCKRTEEQNRPSENSESTSLPAEFQNQTSFAPSMPNLISESDKGVGFWNGTDRDNDVISAKSSAFQPLDCTKRDGNLDRGKRDPQTHSDMSTGKVPNSSEPGNMSFDNLVSYYGDTRRISDGGYDFVEMTERLVNNSEKGSVNNHQIPPMAMTRPCDPRLQQSQAGNNPSIYNKVAPRYSSSNFQHFKPPVHPDPYYNFKHPMNPSKYFGYDNSQIIDPNYEYHKMAPEFDPARLYTNKDATKDPRRLFHPELDKSTEGTFLDPLRKAQLSDFYQDKATCEYNNADPDQFISPIIVKKSDLSGRDKVYPDKSNSIRDRMDVINNENQNLSEKTVLITSQNGPPEIFSVPYSPEKESAHKDNVVTLHSGDQTKSNTITVEVPYVQQYSTLVKLSEEISRAEQVDGKNKTKKNEVTSPSKSTSEETKKPTSFKLKRLPNSKEWTVENQQLREANRVAPEGNMIDSENTSSCEVLGERDASNQSAPVSNLNMPSLDDFREEENCEAGAENLSKTKMNDNKICSTKVYCSVDDSIKNNKFNSQTPQMAIVQPMKMSKCDGNKLESEKICKISMKDCKDTQLLEPIGSLEVSNSNESSFDPEKLISSTSSNMEIMPENNISKHENFRTHKKIQSFPTRIPNCLQSPSEEFLHAQVMGSEGQKEPYSPFHVYPDCDMNSQINEFFKIDDRNASDEKILDNRMPSSPGVEGMFEDINHSNQSNTYQSKNCDFPDLTDSSVNSHNAHFQAFSTIFPDDSDRRERMDGSVLQMNDKKCLKNILGGINSQEIAKSDDTTEQVKPDELKKSPPIPPISLKLKLNESKKMWCIANNNQSVSTNDVTKDLTDNSRSLSHETLDIDAADELEKDLAQAIDEEKRKSENYFGEVQNYSEIKQLLSDGTTEDVPSRSTISDSNILAEGILNDQQLISYQKTTKDLSGSSENKCLTITKYCPRNKILEKINSFLVMQNKPLKTLVFDANGTHFPVKWEEAQNEANSVAKDIVDGLISNLCPDKHGIERNNIAHVAPFCENPGDYQSDENKLTNTFVPDKQMAESFEQCDNCQFVKGTEEKESSVAKTTELFINIEKEYCQHHSVIKTIQSANTIVNKLRRPARSIFSPMSDHGKDDELIESACDKETPQTAANPEENLLNFDNLKDSHKPSQADCFDIENINEDHAMDVDQDDQCSQANEKYDLETIYTESVLPDEIKMSKDKSLYHDNDISRSCVSDQSSTEIDDALELMGLSNTKKSSETSDNMKHPNGYKVTAENNLLYLQESPENYMGIEEQLNSEEDSAHSLVIEQLNNNSERGAIVKELFPLESGNLKMIEENKISEESEILGFNIENETKSKIPDTTISNLEDNAESTVVEENDNNDVLYNPKGRIINTTEEDLLNIKSPKENNANEIQLPQSSVQRISDRSEQSEITFDNCRGTPKTVVAENEDYVSCYRDNEVTDFDRKIHETEDVESRSETSVIVRNETFNKVKENCHNSIKYQKVSPKNDSDSVFNVRNIINDVINNAVSKDISQSRYSTTYPFQSFQPETIKDVRFSSVVEEACPVECVKDRINYTNYFEEPITKCTFEAKKDSCQSMQLVPENSERIKFSVGKTASVITANVVLPLDLTLRIGTGSSFSEKPFYCVSETISLTEERETSLFVKNSVPSYFHEFKKRKWLKFNKSVFSDCSEYKASHSGENHEKDQILLNHSLIENQNDLLSTEGYFTSGSSCRANEIKSGVSVLSKSPLGPESEMSDESSSNNDVRRVVSVDKPCRELGDENSGDEAESTKQVSLEILTEITVKSRDKVPGENQAQDCSIPLKGKVHFYNKKEAHSFLRRDSLKLLEREAVLREIFSPEPELDYSESKENESPESYDQHKEENAPNHADSETAASDAIFNSSVSELPKENLVASQHRCSQIVQEASSQNNFSQFNLDQSKNIGVTSNKVHLSSNELIFNSDNILDKSSFQSPGSLEVQLQLNHDTNVLDSEENYFEDVKSPHSKLSLPKSSTHEGGTRLSNQHTLTKKDSLSSSFSSDIESENNSIDKHSEVASQFIDIGKTPKEESNNESRCTISFSEVGHMDLFQSDLQPTLNDRSRSISPERNSLLSQEKETISQDQEEVSDEISVISKPNIPFCHASHTNDISLKHDKNKEANPMSLVTGKDVLFSTTQPSDDQDDEALNTNLHHKEIIDRDCSYDEEEREDLNINSCQNDKINSVQDSLRNNQHMNKETFPLQCLVEAALALEHVDSKQILNNSNFSGLYSQSDEGFVESPLSDSPSHENLEYATKSDSSDGRIDIVSKKSSQNDLTVVDREIFSKFEETNYNLRASTRIVTSSSSNIIPYSKRKYGLKSAKSPNVTTEIKQKKVETLCAEKIKSKKRRSVFAYPRSKRRRKNNKDKQKSPDDLPELCNQRNGEISVEYEAIENKFDKENVSGNQSENVESGLTKEIESIKCSDDVEQFNSSSQLEKVSIHSPKNESTNDFGGPLLIAGENTSSQGSIFCVHVDSEKMGDYVNSLGVSGLGILSDNNHSLFKDNNTDSIGSDISNVSLENGASLVIIIEDLSDTTEKIQFNDNCKSESDVMLGSIRDADCSDVLTTELSVNESCICPPDIGMKGSCVNDLKSKLSYERSEDLLTTNCYEEINENLINDIGNWPFVEEEVAEFDSKCEFPNEIPEEGRKIELKCSLPWKKIFNISKDISEKQEKKKRKKTKVSRKTSSQGLELGPAKVEVRLKAPSAEWKVISDYHENSSPVVKVSRLILQRESDNSSSSSSFSEKESEEENEHKKQPSECSDLKSSASPSPSSYLTENICQNENWQPIVVLKRSRELDELTSRLQSQTSSVCNSQSSSSDESKNEDSSEDSDSDTSDDDENEHSRCSRSRESSSSCDSFENKINPDCSKKYCQSKFCETSENDRVPYEKYSPTGCGNSLSNEKIYSPSNPHFSPGEVYPDSDNGSDTGMSNHDNGTFLDEATHTTNSNLQITSEEIITGKSNHSESKDADQSEEESNKSFITSPQSKSVILPQSNNLQEFPTQRIPSTDYISDLNNTSLLNGATSEDEMKSPTVGCKSPIHSNSSITPNEIIDTGELSRELNYDQTKKTKRKMPKNFFVRRKVRRNRSELLTSNTSQTLEVNMISSDALNSDVIENSSASLSGAQNDFNNHTFSLSEDNNQISENEMSTSCENSRLQCVYKLEDCSPSRLNESPLPKTFEEKLTLRNCGRGLKRPGEGHSSEDTKRRRKKLRSFSNSCQECNITFKNKEESTRHKFRHAKRRELHHCLLCQRSFSSAARHSLHVQGRSHRHMELTQRHTMHTMHRLLAGGDCPAVPPLTRAELRALQWRPNQPGYTHVYHDTAPLHTVLQEQSPKMGENTISSGEKIGND